MSNYSRIASNQGQGARELATLYFLNCTYNGGSGVLRSLAMVEGPGGQAVRGAPRKDPEGPAPETGGAAQLKAEMRSHTELQCRLAENQTGAFTLSAVVKSTWVYLCVVCKLDVKRFGYIELYKLKLHPDGTFLEVADYRSLNDTRSFSHCSRCKLIHCNTVSWIQLVSSKAEDTFEEAAFATAPVHSPAPAPALLPHMVKDAQVECPGVCDGRCLLHSRKNVCHRVCMTCCLKCKCVPPGTYGYKELCGTCYTNWVTHGNQTKCP